MENGRCLYIILLKMILFLKIITANVNGIRDFRKRNIVFDALAKMKADIIFLQETHSSPEVEIKWEREWIYGHSIWNSGTSASRGVAILLAHNLFNHEMLNIKWDKDGRVLSADLEIFNEQVHLVNVYAPCRTDYRSQKAQDIFFENLGRYLYAKQEIILGGDMNCVLNVEKDRYCPSKKRARKEYVSDALDKLVNTFTLEDSINNLPGMKNLYTWRNCRTQARLDRIYHSKGCQVKNAATVTAAFSDHDIFQIEVEIDGHFYQRGRGYWKNNSLVYDDEDFQSELKYDWILWKTLMPLYRTKMEWWADTKERIKNLVIKHSVKMARREKGELQSDIKKMEKLKLLLDQGKRVLTKYREAKKKVMTKQYKMDSKIWIQNKANEFDMGDKCNTWFFQKIKKQQSQSVLEALKDNDGKRYSTVYDKLRIATKYYRSLYSKHEADGHLQKKILNRIHKKCHEQDSVVLDSPIDKREIVEAVKEMKEKKTPGPDGLSSEFYKKCWETIKTEFTEMIQEAYEKGELLKSMKLGYVSLIHKKDEKDQIENYRPITLLNTDYKICTKVINNRVKNVLLDIIGEQQKAVAGQQMCDVLTILRDVISQESSKNTESGLLSLDFEKAFDSVNHNYLIGVLKRFGFGEKIRKFIKNLYCDMENRILVNGFLSECIFIKKGVRQGDPLSMTMFVVAIEPFLVALQQDNDIKGIRIPGNKEIKAVAYADDVNLTLSGILSIRKAISLAEEFEKVTGMRLNKAKTRWMKISKWERPKSLAFVQENIQLKILGLTFAKTDTSENNWAKCLEKIKNTIKMLSPYRFTLDGKSLMVKAKLVPLMLHTARVFPIPRNIAMKITSEIEKFVFDGKRLLKLETLCKKRENGGYDIVHIPIFADCMYMHQVTKYQMKREVKPFGYQFVEYNVGRQLSNLFHLHVNNAIPHALDPQTYYKVIMDYIEKYNITEEELKEKNQKALYSKAVEKVIAEKLCLLRPAMMGNVLQNIHCKILSNAMKSFNFKLMWDVLPLKTKPNIKRIAGNETCVLCCKQPEFASHLFWSCEVTQRVYEYVTNVIIKFCPTFNPVCNVFYLLDLSTLTNVTFVQYSAILLLVSIARYKMWVERNGVIFQNRKVCANSICQKLKIAVKMRKMIETRRENSKFMPQINLLVDHMC